MTNKVALSSFILLILLSISCSTKNQETDDLSEFGKNPNVIFILADDLGYGDLSCYNSKSKIATPNLDQLANEGMRFTDAHTPSSVCTPTRYGLLTGQYAWRSPLKKGVLQSYELELIADSIETMADVFKKGGYHTAHIGKWHLGYDWKVKEGYPTSWSINEMWLTKEHGQRFDFSKGIPGGPKNAGFDYSYGFDAPNIPPYCFWENEQIIGEIPTTMKPDSLYGNAGLMQNEWDLREVFPSLETRMLSYLGELAQKEQPFFLYLPLTAPHVPLLPTDDARGKSQAGLYGDFVIDVDDLVGKLITRLKMLNMIENTIVVFTSDNGSSGRIEDPWHGNGRTYFTGSGDIIKTFEHYPNGDFRGLKGDNWEGGHRVPMIVSWPQKIKAGVENQNLVSLTDWMSLVYQLTDVEKPADQAIDSYDLMSAIKDPTRKIRNHMVHHSAKGKFAIRKDNWKLILSKGAGAGYSEFYDPKGEENDFEGQLYNLASDPKERKNLYDQFPLKVKAMTILLDSIKAIG